jgi:hypothetical protein
VTQHDRSTGSLLVFFLDRWLPVSSISLPTALIKARIALGMTQKGLQLLAESLVLLRADRYREFCSNLSLLNYLVVKLL